jgi:hypothetical protein
VAGAAKPRDGGITPRVGVANVQVRAQARRRSGGQERMAGGHTGDGRLPAAVKSARMSLVADPKVRQTRRSDAPAAECNLRTLT